MSDRETVLALFKAVGHPIRLELLIELERVELADMARKSSSPVELAALTDVPLGVVAYHVRILHKRRLIRRAGARPVRGAVEHFYRLTDRGRAALELIP